MVRITFSSLLSNGYWNLSPDAGTADYDVWLYPKDHEGFTTYTVYKRPTASTTWNVYGLLSNPESTLDNIQSDGSVRRSGLVGFSDFAIGVGDLPLPLSFLDFTASRKLNSVKLENG